MDTKFGFEDIKRKLVAMRRETLVLLANQAQNYFVKSFKNQGFNGEPWKEVKRRDPDENAYKYPKTKGLQRQTSPILIGAGFKKRGGTLRMAVATMARTAEIGSGTLRMVVDLPYAAIQNEGGEGLAFGKHSFTMKKRQFIGQTTELTQMQMKKLDEIVTRIFKR